MKIMNLLQKKRTLPPKNDNHLDIFNRFSFQTDNTTNIPAKNIIAVPTMINPSVTAHSGGKFGFVHCCVFPLNVMHICVNPNFVSPRR